MIGMKLWGALALLSVVGCSAGRSDGGTRIGEPEYPDAPSCQELSAQYATCANVSDKKKEEFVAACQLPQITDACRRCIDGKLCGDTSACAASCGK